MKKSRFTEEQIAFALRQAESGTSIQEITRLRGVHTGSCVAKSGKVRQQCQRFGRYLAAGKRGGKSGKIPKIHVPVRIKIQRFTAVKRRAIAGAGSARTPFSEINEVHGLVAVEVTNATFVGTHVQPIAEHTCVTVEVGVARLRNDQRITGVDTG